MVRHDILSLNAEPKGPAGEKLAPKPSGNLALAHNILLSFPKRRLSYREFRLVPQPRG